MANDEAGRPTHTLTHHIVAFHTHTSCAGSLQAIVEVARQAAEHSSEERCLSSACSTHQQLSSKPKASKAPAAAGHQYSTRTASGSRCSLLLRHHNTRRAAGESSPVRVCCSRSSNLACHASGRRVAHTRSCAAAASPNCRCSDLAVPAAARVWRTAFERQPLVSRRTAPASSSTMQQQQKQ
jgi:hypothetical protein